MHGHFWLGFQLLSLAIVLGQGQYYPYTGYPSSEYYNPYGYGYNDFYYPWNWNSGCCLSDYWFGNGWYGGWSDWSLYWWDYLIFYYAGDGWMYDDRENTWRPYSKEQACTWCLNYWIPLVGQASADKKCPSFCTSSSTPSTVSKHN